MFAEDWNWKYFLNTKNNNEIKNIKTWIDIDIILTVDNTLNQVDKIFNIPEISIENLEYLLTKKWYKLTKLSNYQDKWDIDENTYGIIVNLINADWKIIQELCLTCPKISQKWKNTISLIVPWGEKVLDDNSEIVRQFKMIHTLTYLENNGDDDDNTIIHSSLLHSTNRP
jgi:hypothetical protein